MAFTLKDYEIIDTVGSGAFGTVYRARQKSLDRLVAIKSLSPQRAQDSTEIMRFRREAHAMAALAHDNIISVYDYAYQGGSYYIVMEYVEGFTFEEALDRGVPVSVGLEVIRRVAEGLGCAHRASIIHRDIKPGNILLGGNGRVKLADFGLAAFQAAFTSQSMGAAVGTLSYMAPEAMVNPAEVDVRADIFSLGCVLYQVLCGRLAFPGATIAEVSYRIINEPPPEPTVSSERAPAVEIALRCLDKDRDRRPSAEETARALGEILRSRFPTAGDELAEFVRGETPRTGSVGPVGGGARPVRRLSKTMAGAAGALSVAAVAVAVVLGVRSGRGVEAPLPDVSADGAVPAIEPSPPRSRLDGESASVRRDGPAPLTSLSADERTATLIITGLRAGDTILVNGSRAHIVGRAGPLGLPLEVGENRLEIRGPGERRFDRSINASVLEVISWDLGKRGDGHE